jgi:hypothetical protein
MSSTARKRLADTKAILDADKAAINHSAEWREFVEALREHLRLSLSNTSKYSAGHASATDGR